MKKHKPIQVGDVFQLNNGGSCTVIQSNSWDDIIIRHNDAHGHVMRVQSSSLRRGGVRNPYWPSVYGVGFVGVGKHKASEGRVQPREYNLWVAMLQRAYDEKLHKKHPSYIGVTVCPEWHSFQNFAEWFKSQPNRDLPGGHIDKDLTVIGNKTYSPDACYLVPAVVNTVVTDCTASRGNLPVGVVFKKRDNRYYAQMNIDGVMRHLGSYSSPEDAFLVYKEKREERIKIIAEENKSKISEKIYKNLMSWEISPF